MTYPNLPAPARIAIVIAVVCGSALMISHGMFHGRSGLSDFAGYYTASSVAARGDSVERMYDDAWFVQHIKGLGLSDTSKRMYVNPPPVSLVMIPLVRFQPQTAKLLWNCISILTVGVIFLVCRRMFRIPGGAGYNFLFAGMITATVPFLRNLQLGQLYVVMLLLVVLFLQGMRTRNAWLAGISLGALLALKYFGWMFLLLLLATRRWKEFAIAMASLAAAIAGMTVCFGTSLYAEHVHRLLGALASSDFALTRLPALLPFFGGFFVYHRAYNPFPIVDAPWVAGILTLGTVFGFLWLTIRHLLQESGERFDRACSGVLVLSVIATPLAAEHHYILLIPALWHYFFSGIRKLDGIMLFSYVLLAYLLLGWFPSIGQPFNAWYSQLPAYPHLFGGLLLWAGLIYRQEEAGIA